MSNEDTAADADRHDARTTSTESETDTATGEGSTPAETEATQEDYTIEDVLAQVEVLQEENRRLRTDYVRAQQTEYRRAALVLLIFSGLAGGGGLVFPDVRATLFGLAGIGIVTAILIYYLTPQHVATATVGERAYATLALLGDAISADLGLQDTRVYVPMTTEDEATSGPVDARLFIPLHTTYTIPEPAQLSSVFIVSTDAQMQGLSLPPTGGLLVRECRQTMVDDLATTPTPLLEQLTDSLVAGFELADDAVAEVDAEDGQATVGIRNSTFGAVDRFDHPLPSFVATGLAVGLQTPVERAALTTTDAGEFETTMTYTWDPEDVASPTATDTERADQPPEATSARQ